MNKTMNAVPKSLIFLIFLCWGVKAFSNPPELPFVITDRDIYFAGEEISAACWLDSLSSECIGDVLYVELVNPLYPVVFKTKIKIDNNLIPVSIPLPNDIASGNYMICVYSRWMATWENPNFLAKIVTVINPQRKGEINRTLNSECSVILDSIPILKGFSDFNGIERNESFPKSGNYHGSESDIVSITCKNSIYNSPVMGYMQYRLENQTSVSFPDYNGTGIFARVVNRENGSPAPSASVFFTFTGSDELVYKKMSDLNGLVVFSISDSPEGNTQLFVSPEDTAKYEVIILSDFLKPGSNIFPQLMVNPSSESWLTLINRNSILNKYLSPIKTEEHVLQDSSNYIFYIQPDIEVYLKDYIELSSLEEVFKELIPGVVVNQSKGEYQVKVLDHNTNQIFENPLILLNGIRVTNLSSLFAISPKSIEKINVINQRYLRGNAIFYGIVSIETKDGNLSGYSPSAGEFFFEYQIASAPEFTGGDAEEMQEKWIQRFRTTYTWWPGGPSSLNNVIPDGYILRKWTFSSGNSIRYYEF